jgi:hypothetical protein
MLNRCLPQHLPAPEYLQTISLVAIKISFIFMTVLRFIQFLIHVSQHGANSSVIIISLRVQMSIFVLSLEIEDRDEVDNWAKHKKTELYVLFYFQADHKKKSNMKSFIFFCCSYINY